MMKRTDIPPIHQSLFLSIVLVLSFTTIAAYVGLWSDYLLETVGLFGPIFLIISALTFTLNRYLIDDWLSASWLPVGAFMLSLPLLKIVVFYATAALKRITVVRLYSFALLILVAGLVALYGLVFFLLSRVRLKRDQQLAPIALTISCALLLFYLLRVFPDVRKLAGGQLIVWCAVVFLVIANISYFAAKSLVYSSRWVGYLNAGFLLLISVLFGYSLLKTYSYDKFPRVWRNPVSASVFYLYRPWIRVEIKPRIPERDPIRVSAELFGWKWKCAGQPKKPLNIVVIAVDALRSDHTPFWGYKRNVIPQIAAFARREGIVFRNAFAPSPSTHFTLPSMVTGIYPSSLVWNTKTKLRDMDQQNVPIQVLLRKNGYRTGAFVMRWVYGMMKGFRRGFDRYGPNVIAKESQRTRKRAAALTTFRAIEFLRGTRHRPFFLFLHYEDPHQPYWTHPPPDRRFGRSAKDRYDGEIAYTDARIGVLLEYLALRKDWQRTIVIITADHGEEFGEHGMKYHSRQLFKESIHVPLVMRLPGYRHRTIDSNVSLVDIVPTLLEMTCIKPPHAKFQGRSLLPLAQGKVVPDRFVFSEGFNFGKKPRWELRSVLFRNMHLISNETLRIEYYFDFIKDPKEKRNLIATPTPLLKQLRRALQEFKLKSRW